MKNVMECYPLVSNEAIDCLNVNLIDLYGEYTNGKEIEKVELNDEEGIGKFFLDDKKSIWSPNNNLKIKGELHLSNTDLLFEKYAVAERDSILGIALVCKSPKSFHTYTKSIGEIAYNKKSDDFEFEATFDEHEVVKELDIEFIIYLKKQKRDSDFFCNTIGSELGTIYSFKVIFEGSGSQFPIQIVDEENGSLWDYYGNFDIDSEFCSEFVSLNLNRAHKDFDYFNTEEINNKNSVIWKEILANFFTLFITDVKAISNFDIILDEQTSLLPGSVGEYAKYLCTLFELTNLELSNDVTSSISLFRKIRKQMDKII